MTFSETCI